jgi:hypothetical protein
MMGKVRIERVGTGIAYDVIVDGQRVDSLRGDGEVATIEREGNFIVFLKKDFSDGYRELKISVGASDNKDVYVSDTSPSKFRIISRDEIDKYRRKNSCAGGIMRFFMWWAIGIGAILLLGLMSTCSR